MLTRTEDVKAYEDLCRTICWDDDEDPERKLSDGFYAVCGGEWRREKDNQWRFWQDDAVMDELRALNLGTEPVAHGDDGLQAQVVKPHD